MNFEHYKNFVAIVDAGTVSAASKELLIAQPALSNQIKNLEDLYGAQLIVRKPRHIELTDAGKILYEKIKSMCYLEDSARKEIDACVSGNRGTLWFGTSPAIPDPLLYQILLDYHEQYPEVTFEIFERNSGHIIDLMQTGMLEVGLIRAQSNYLPPDIRPVLRVQEKMMVYFHREHPLFSPEMKSIPLNSLKDQPISISNGLKKGFTTACEAEGFTPSYMNVSASRSTSRLWAADKRTVCIISVAAPFDEDEYCAREISGRGLITHRMFAVNKNRRLSSVAETFLDFCRQHPLMSQWMRGAEQERNRRSERN